MKMFTLRIETPDTVVLSHCGVHLHVYYFQVLLEKMRGLPPVAHAPPIKVREETLVVHVVRVVSSL